MGGGTLKTGQLSVSHPTHPTRHHGSPTVSQVTMMLPGGLSVVGVFLVGPPELLKTMLPRLRQLLADVCRDSTLHPLPHRSRSLLHVCTRTKKYALTFHYRSVMTLTQVLHWWFPLSDFPKTQVPDSGFSRCSGVWYLVCTCQS